MVTDITPKYNTPPMKEKVVLVNEALIFGQKVGGLTGNATSIQQGSGNQIFKVDYTGLWLGAADFADAPFSVSMAGAIVATDATITGTIQTATSGQRIVISSADNTLRFYDSSSQVIGIGSTSATAIRLDLNSVSTTGMQIVGGSGTATGGFIYSNTNATNNRGLEITQSSTSSLNNLSAIKLSHAGSGALIEGFQTGSGKGILLERTSGTGIAPLIHLRDSITASGTILQIASTSSTGSGTIVDILNDSQGIGILLDQGHATAAVPALKIISASSSASATALLIDKNNSGMAMEIDMDANDGNNTVGMKMNIANAGAGNEYAFEMLGSEYDASKTGVSGLTGVVRILTSDGAVFIPVYNTAT